VEWEYAARAGSTTEFPWGDSCNGKEANIDGNYPFGISTKGTYLGVTTKVGSYPPNAWGLNDTVGNVREWCLDGYDEDFYERSPLRDPRNPEAPGGGVVCRSGSWGSNGTVTRSANRYGDTPGGMYGSVGFRVVAE
jgi:formylglycine-generating enzyme required for sulfatase activity